MLELIEFGIYKVLFIHKKQDQFIKNLVWSVSSLTLDHPEFSVYYLLETRHTDPFIKNVLPPSMQTKGFCLKSNNPSAKLIEPDPNFKPLTDPNSLTLPTQADFTQFKLAKPAQESSNLSWLLQAPSADTQLAYDDMDAYNTRFKSNYAKDCTDFKNFDLKHPTTEYHKIALAPIVKRILDLLTE